MNTIGRLGCGLLLAVLLCLPRPAWTADADIGVIFPECCQAYETAMDRLREILIQGGYSEDKIYVQKPTADPISWANSFRKFVGFDVDLIIIFGDDLVDVACRDKSKVPVVFGFVSDPAGAACVKGEEKPGGNVTGVSSRAPLFTLLEKTSKISAFSTIGVFSLKSNRLSSQTLREIESHGGKLGYSVVPIEVSQRTEIAGSLSSVPSFDILFLPNFAVGEETLKTVTAAAKGGGLPTVSLRPAEKGASALLSLYPDPEEQGRLMGEMALAVLGGAAPGNTSVRSPKKIELELDVAMAKQLGLKVPIDILQSATKVRK